MQKRVRRVLLSDETPSIGVGDEVGESKIQAVKDGVWTSIHVVERMV